MATKKQNRVIVNIGKLFLAMGLTLMFSVAAMAQPNELEEPDDPVVPFDSGISLLVAAGVAYGAKQWRQGRKENKEPELTEE